MTDFQEWWEVRKAKSQGMYDAKSLSEAAFLAGQASAEQRVKWQDDLIQELQAKCAELERERDQWKYTAEIRQQHLEYTIKAQAGEPVGYHFSYTTPFGHVVWDIDYTPRPDAIECYPLVRAHPTTERCVPEGWKIVRADSKPFKRIEIVAPNGYSTVVDSLSRNPENILYMLAETMINAAPKQEGMK